MSSPNGTVTRGAGQGHWRRRLGPERIAGVLAAIVLLGGVAVSSIDASRVGVPQPSAPTGSRVPTSTAHPFAGTATLALQIQERLAEDQQVLESQLAASEFDVSKVVATVRSINGTARLGSDVASALRRSAGSRALGEDLQAFHETVVAAADDVLGMSVASTAAYRRAAEHLQTTLEPTDDLRRRLVALIAETRATAGPTSPAPSIPPTDPAPSPSPSPTIAPTPTASPIPTATATATRPTSTLPAASPAVGQVRNPGFEATSPAPWVLAVAPPAVATLAIDATTVAQEGQRSARVDISVPSDSRAAVSLRQGGIRVAQGHRYVCRLALRASSLREVRVRVANSSGATYGTRLVTVGPAWSVVEFEFGSFVEDPGAMIEIDLGRSTATTWIDDVRITDSSADAP